MFFWKHTPDPLFTISKRGQLWLSCAITLLLAILFVSTCWGIRYTQYDDVTYIQSLIDHGNLWDAARGMATGQGRIQFLLGIAITDFFTGFADSILFDCFHYGAVFICFLLFFLAIAAYAGRVFAVIATTALVGTLVLTWNHTIITSGPVWFYSSFSAGLGSIVLLYKYQTSHQKRFLVMSLLALAYSYVNQEYHPPIITALWLAACLANPNLQRGSSLRTRLQNNRIAFTSGLLLSLVWLAAYLTFRLYYGTSYDGASLPTAEFVKANNLKPFDLSLFFKVIFTYSFSSSSYYWATHGWSFAFSDPLLFEGAKVRIWPPNDWISTIFNWRYLGTGLLAFAAVWLALHQTTAFSRLKLITLFALGLLVMFGPNIMLAITPRHQAWVQYGGKFYAYTVYSHFGLAVLLTIIGVFLVNVTPQRFRAVTTFICALIVGVGAWGASYQNDEVSKTMHRATDRWEAVDFAMKHAEFRELLENQNIVAPHIWNFYWSVPVQPNWWDRYVQYKYNVTAHFTVHPEGGNALKNKKLRYFDISDIPGCNTRAVMTGELKQQNDRYWIVNPRVALLGNKHNAYLNGYDEGGAARSLLLLRQTRVNNHKNIFDIRGSFALDTVRFDCLPRVTGLDSITPYRVGNTVDFRKPYLDGIILGRGWAGSNGNYRWSLGNKASFLLYTDEKAKSDLTATLEASALIAPPKLMSQHVIIWVNSKQVGQLEIKNSYNKSPVAHKFNIPQEAWNEANPIVVAMETLDAAMPASLGVQDIPSLGTDEDDRYLGIAVKSLTFTAK